MTDRSHVGPHDWPSGTVLPGASTLPALLEDFAADTPGAPAVSVSDAEYSYAQLQDVVDTAATALHSLQTGPGTHVALLATNTIDWLAVAFGAMRLGAQLEAFNTWVRSYDLEHLLEASGAEILILTPIVGDHDMVKELCPLVPELWSDQPGAWRSDRYPHLRTVVMLGDHPDPPRGVLHWKNLLNEVSTAAGGGPAPSDASQPGDTAMVLYTSGSTKRPKAVPLVHQELILNGFAIGERMGLAPSDRVWLGSPLFWSFGIANAVMATMTHGACLVLQERFSPVETAQLLKDARCTAAYLLPSMVDGLASVVAAQVRELQLLRTGVTIGRPDELLRIVQELGIDDICNVYGSTETYGNCCVTPHDMPVDARSQCQGAPLPGVEIRIVHPDGQVARTGQHGEIQVRGRIMSGYIDDEQATSAAFTSDGWFRTGDTGLILADGSLRFIARHSEMIKTSGINVSPAEVESYISRHPAVDEVAVVGAPDSSKGEIVVAFVTSADPALDAEGIIDFCRGSIASYKIPRKVFIVDQLPKTGTGKLLRRELVTTAQSSVEKPAKASESSRT